MYKKYIIIGAIFLLIVTGFVDWTNFKNNGGHNGNSITDSGEDSARVAGELWIEKFAPTYVFDGTNLQFIGSGKGACERCFVFDFSFDSSHGGYGNREGLFVTQVITPHVISIEVKDGKVVRAVTDKKYNELTGAIAE